VVIIARPCPHEFGFLGEGIAGHAGGSGREKAGGGPAEIPISRPKCNKDGRRGRVFGEYCAIYTDCTK